MTPSTDLFATLLRKEARRKKRRAAIERGITGFITNILAAFTGGWELMIAVGIAHDEWIHALPTIGYWWAVLLVYLLRGTFSTIRNDRKDKADA